VVVSLQRILSLEDEYSKIKSALLSDMGEEEEDGDEWGGTTTPKIAQKDGEQQKQNKSEQQQEQQQPHPPQPSLLAHGPVEAVVVVEPRLPLFLNVDLSHGNRVEQPSGSVRVEPVLEQGRQMGGLVQCMLYTATNRSHTNILTHKPPNDTTGCALSDNLFNENV
jgi:hypothetical protein